MVAPIFSSNLIDGDAITHIFRNFWAIMLFWSRISAVAALFFSQMSAVILSRKLQIHVLFEAKFIGSTNISQLILMVSA